MLGFNKKIEIPLMEEFYTIQGEGFFTGRPAYFIRLAGCDVGCTWCDVKESWNPEIHPLVKIEDIIKNVEKSGADFVVITGGEPTIYDLEPITQALHKIEVQIAIETSGAYPITGEIDWICLSPKKFKLPLEENYSKANELKVIAFNQHDFKWAKELEEKVALECQLYIQPEWNKKEEMIPFVVDFVKNNIDWNISLQTHKYLGIE